MVWNILFQMLLLANVTVGRKSEASVVAGVQG